MTTDRFQPGIYQIYSYAASSDIALDLSGGDLKSILGFPAHQGCNQKWELSPLGKGYSIRSLHNSNYVSLEDGLCNLSPVVANPYPVSWALAPFDADSGIWRITWPNTALTVGLPEVVGNEPNTLARLVKIDSFGMRSLWRFVPQRFAPEAAPASSTTSDAQSEPTFPVSLTTTDTKMESDGNLMVTTTTTTVVTTIKKVAKTMACST